MTETQVYYSAGRYHNLLDQLENLFKTHDPAAPDCLRSRLIMILGEEGGLWPTSCFTGQDDGSPYVAV